MAGSVPTKVDCEQCGKTAEYAVRMRKNNILSDVYVCQSCDHYTYVKCEEESTPEE